MSENSYLTRLEQKIFAAISFTDIVTIEEIKDLLPDLKTYQINKTCSSLSSKGYLYRLKRGTYLFQEKPADIPFSHDRSISHLRAEGQKRSSGILDRRMER